MPIKKISQSISKILPGLGMSELVRPKPIHTFNPKESDTKHRQQPLNTKYHLISYTKDDLVDKRPNDVEALIQAKMRGANNWFNIDGLSENDIDIIGDAFDIHFLAKEDILSIGQRAKMDVYDDALFCLLPMIYYNDELGLVEKEQVSIVLGADYVLSFQEDPLRDVLDPVRYKIYNGYSKLRSNATDYLLYAILDCIVDSYFDVMQQLDDHIETLETQLINDDNKSSLNQFAILRREIMVLIRLISPVQEMLNALVRSNHPLLINRNKKYFKDILDHSTQAKEHAENLRDMLLNLQDFFMSKINLRMNNTMRIFTIITTLLAPATVIGGIFGMNFDAIPLTHHQMGFYIAVTLMLIIPLFMLIWFKKKGWY